MVWSLGALTWNGPSFIILLRTAFGFEEHTKQPHIEADNQSTQVSIVYFNCLSRVVGQNAFTSPSNQVSLSEETDNSSSTRLQPLPKAQETALQNTIMSPKSMRRTQSTDYPLIAHLAFLKVLLICIEIFWEEGGRIIIMTVEIITKLHFPVEPFLV